MIAVPEALEVADNAPQVAAPQPAPVSVQVTPLFRESFCIVAVMLAVFPVCTEPLVLATLTTIAAGGVLRLMVTFVDADLEASATEVAVIVTVAGDGTLPGAV